MNSKCFFVNQLGSILIVKNKNRYEDGNLVENLNDTTSLTYEVMKPTATSK
jgi:hypothetical protein